LAPTTKGSKKSHSAIEEVTPEYTMNIHNCIHRGFQEVCPMGKEIWKFGMKEMETPDIHIDTRLNTAVQAKGITNVPYCIQVALSRKHNKDEDSPNSIHWLPIYL
ncbi:hypothetical protein PANDA_012504, partial [Ailuropoda melanoleuca]